ncbi:hypothetical protein FBUS_05947 [Fasciolopsis buskii]|uniref:Uncharacterized protein n=1 Tax=Fasciolopsis buskii TaxID=27845 RepID=A0A8E0RZZ7_9TREM|nr:hypothetical protein FBUS_05947 [Fasciolopsis buski]
MNQPQNFCSSGSRKAWGESVDTSLSIEHNAGSSCLIWNRAKSMCSGCMDLTGTTKSMVIGLDILTQVNVTLPRQMHCDCFVLYCREV